jgi:hypothetical protein
MLADPDHSMNAITIWYRSSFYQFAFYLLFVFNFNLSLQRKIYGRDPTQRELMEDGYISKKTGLPVDDRAATAIVSAARL